MIFLCGPGKSLGTIIKKWFTITRPATLKTPRKQTLSTQARTMHLFYGGFNFTETNSIGAGIGNFVHDRSLFLQIWSWASDQGNNVLEWLKQPREQLPEEWTGQNERWLTRPTDDVLALIMAWWITFTVVLLLLFALGFNPIGIGAGMTFLVGEISISLFSYLFSLSVRLILMQQVL